MVKVGMSSPYRTPHHQHQQHQRGGYASGSSRHRQGVRGQDSRPQQYQRQPYAGYGYVSYGSQYQDDCAYGGYGSGGYYESYPAAYYPSQQQGYEHPYYGGAQGYAQSHGNPGWPNGSGRGGGCRGNNGREAQAPHRHGAGAGSATKGAPEAPKKMRQAAQHSQYVYNQHLSSYPPPPANYYQQTQQGEYHSNSRYSPYTRNNDNLNSLNSSDARIAPPRILQASIRSSPRDSYILTATQPSTLLSDADAEARKLLVVLDLNGTLVFRAKRGNGRALDSVRAVPRPYLFCFLRYCLGTPSSPAHPNQGSEGEGKRDKPHGSHFWSTCAEPQSSGRAEVVVWSSAQPLNVDSMVKASFDPSIRSQLKRVWARDTLVPNRLFALKAESVKDLEIVWAELNAFASQRPSPARLLAENRDRLDRERPDDVAPTSPAGGGGGGNKYEGKHNKHKQVEAKEKEREKISAALEAALEAEKLGPWGQHNTVLVDDSVTKARLQPYNQLVIPEFGEKDAAMMRKFILQQLPSDAEEKGSEGELEYASDLSIPEMKAPPSTTNGGDQEIQPKSEGKKKKPIPESRLDDVLLQTIGVLSVLRYQYNVSSFIRAGGIKGYGEPTTALKEKQKGAKVEHGNTPEYWAEKGRKACEEAGIQVKAWVPGEAANATAALL
ncbi:uncharacterized protein UBRO2_01574 [Ustilago bromivora]|uniref:FCP1 homology domain-containing protein n=2 Tax=Ustilago bromivora TaxID=307758 RepID=A0A8H8TR61_9BASI|nr:uncharacterized protein UBRO2_01574 [Ustilago bromivora]